MSPAATKAAWRSGFCGTAHHGGCRGTYSFATCMCACHEPLAVPEPVSDLEPPVLIDSGPSVAYHCVTCMCPERAGAIGVEAMVAEALPAEEGA